MIRYSIAAAALIFSADSSALLSTNIFVAPNLPEIQMVLRPEKGVGARVTDGEGNPIAGARVALKQYGTFTPFEWDGTETDSEGRFRWDAAPFEPTEMFILPTNGPIRKVTLRAGEPEPTIVIRAEQAELIRLTGTVMDAETEEPVQDFTVESAGAGAFKAGGRRLYSGPDGAGPARIPFLILRKSTRTSTGIPASPWWV